MQTSDIELVFDCDGVIADLLSGMVQILNEQHGEDLKNEDMIYWDFHKSCKGSVTAKEVYDHFSDEEFWYNLKPIDGAPEWLSKLIDEDFDVSIVTACAHGYHEKRDWLKKYIPNFNLRKLNFSAEKFRFQSDLFVDDHTGNLYPYMGRNPKALTICFDAPYNQEWEYERVKNWEELYTRIWNYYDFLKVKAKK
jgi:5'(3')-deoxyribonucleotidase